MAVSGKFTDYRSGNALRTDRPRLWPTSTHLRADRAWSDHEHSHSGSGNPVSQPLKESVEPGLGGAVDVLRLARPFCRHRREHDQQAVPLCAKVRHDRHGHRHGAGKIRLHDLVGRLTVGFALAGFAVCPEREEHGVDVVGTGKHLLHESGMVVLRSPNVLITAKNGDTSALRMRSMTSRITSACSGGTTNWYSSARLPAKRENRSKRSWVWKNRCSDSKLSRGEAAARW